MLFGQNRYWYLLKRPPSLSVEAPKRPQKKRMQVVTSTDSATTTVPNTKA